MPRISPLLIIVLIASAAAPWVIYGAGFWDIVMTTLDHCPEMACDFKRHYLPQAHLVADGIDKLMPAWFYPPALALFLQPLVYVDSPIYWWTAFNIATAGGMAWLIARVIHTAPTIEHYTVGLALVMTSLPIWHSIKWGQISLLLCLLMCLGLTFMSRRGSVLIGVAAAIKGYPVLAVLLPLIQRRAPLVVWTLGTAALVGVMIPLAWMGFDAVVLYFEQMNRAGSMLLERAPQLGGQALLPSLKRWFSPGAYVHPQLHPLDYPLIFPLTETQFTVSWALSFIIISGASLRALLRVGLPHKLKVAVFLCWMSLMLPPGWHHYFSFLPLAMAIVWFSSELIVPRTLVSAAFGVGLLPLMGIGNNFMAYFDYSALGGTTVVCMLTLFAGIWASASFPDTIGKASQMPVSP